MLKEVKLVDKIKICFFRWKEELKRVFEVDVGLELFRLKYLNKKLEFG
jgi:hypothetical protein